MNLAIKLVVACSLFVICSCSSNDGDFALSTTEDDAHDAAAARAASGSHKLSMKPVSNAEDGDEEAQLLETGEASKEKLKQNGSTSAVQGSSLDSAKQLFDRYVALGAAFDPAAAELYADSAKIENTRVYPNGSRRVLSWPALTYKQLIRQAMPIAKARGDTNTYSDITFAPEGEQIRVTANRFSNLKEYTSPLSLLVGPNKDGVWHIYEELSESRP